MEPKYRKFYIEWWNIKKSTIYSLATFALLATFLLAGGWWASRNNWFVGTEPAGMPKDAARIIFFEGDVRVTRAATRETILVTKATFVAAGDTIQTQADGRATVQMIDGSVYTVRPNSTIVVRDNSSIFGGVNVRVTLDDGQLNVKTEEQPENTENIVEFAESENKILEQTDASFNVDQQTKGGEIRISRGGVESTMGGQTTTIRENEFAAIDRGQLTSREKLLEPPRQNSPSNSAQVVDLSGSGAGVQFSWQDASSGAESYYLQIAKSPYFASDSILVDRVNLASRSFRLTGLSPGIYYWRLKSTGRSGQTTNWNDPWKFTVVKRAASRRIEAADWRVENMGGNIYIVSAKTEPGLIVRSMGREVFAAADGSFQLQISTAAAAITVEIGDDRGNLNGFNVSLRTGKATRQ